MKRLALICGFVVFFLLPLAAFAEEQNQETVIPVVTPNVGYKSGFFIQNDDGSFKLTIKSTVRTKFYYSKMTKGGASQVSFQFRSASLTFDAKIHEKASVGFDLLHATGSVPGGAGQPNTTFQTVNVNNATASYGVIPEFAVAVGMVGLPLDMDPGRLLTEPPFTSTQTDGEVAITPLRSSFGAPAGLGIAFSGSIWKFDYEFNVINGNEDNYTVNPDKKFEFGGRLAFNVLDPAGPSPSDLDCSTIPKLTVNAGGFYQNKRTDPNTTADIKYQLNGTLGVRFKWAGLGATAQGYYRKSRFTSIGNAAWARPNLTDFGYYAGVGYFVLPKTLEVAAQAGQIFRQGPDNDSWQMGGGLNYYIFSENFKTQLAYTLTVDFDDIAGSQSNKIHKVDLQLQAKF